MSDSAFSNTSLLEVTVSSKNEHVCVRDLNDFTLSIIIEAGWASMNVGTTGSIGWNYSRHAPLRRFDFHWAIEETSHCGIISIICHQVLCHPSDHGTRSMWNHLLANVHNEKLYKLTQSEVTELTSSMVDETSLAILKREGRRGITIVSSQRKFIFDN